MSTSKQNRARATQSVLFASLLSLVVAAPALAGECPKDKVGSNPLPGAAPAPVGVPSGACATGTWKSSPAASSLSTRTPTVRR